MVVREDYFTMGSKVKFKINSRCNINGTKDLVSLIKLPSYPITEQFGKFDKNFPNFDQELVISRSSGHVQLKYILDQNYLYSPQNYNYRSQSSLTSNHQLDVFINFIKKNHINKINSILDVGGNDSYVINRVAQKKAKKYVIDPVGVNKDKDIIVINKFLKDVDLSKDITKPDLVICRHTLEHIPEPKLFLNKLMSECDDKCNFVFEVPSLERMIETQRFDAIMHQHISYFSVKSLKLLIESCGGVINSYQIFEKGSCGGSIIFSFKKTKNKKQKRKEKKTDYIKNYKTIKKGLENFKGNMILLKNLIDNTNGKLTGYGAGLMLSNYIYFLKINTSKIKYILDDDKKKHNWQYKNLNVRIKYPKKIKHKKSENYIVTSLENKKILIAKIITLNPNNIYFPIPA